MNAPTLREAAQNARSLLDGMPAPNGYFLRIVQVIAQIDAALAQQPQAADDAPRPAMPVEVMRDAARIRFACERGYDRCGYDETAGCCVGAECPNRASPAAPTAPTQQGAAGDALRDMEARKDAAYLERNRVVAALAKAYPSGVARTAIEGWSEDWHGCVYIDLPTGQASWHFHDSQAYLFADLPPYTGKWDGHDTPEKYRRLAALPVTHPAA